MNKTVPLGFFKRISLTIAPPSFNVAQYIDGYLKQYSDKKGTSIKPKNVQQGLYK